MKGLSPKDMLNRWDAADYIGYGWRSIEEWKKSGKLRSFKIVGGQICVDKMWYNVPKSIIDKRCRWVILKQDLDALKLKKAES